MRHDERSRLRAADPPHAMLFEDPQKLRLRGERQLTDFVEEHRTLPCRLEEPDPIGAWRR